MLKIKKIQNKEEIEVLAQYTGTDCSTKSNPYGKHDRCDSDCNDRDEYSYYGSPKY
ncbi:MAG: hypothetical protein N4A48_02995 [Tepidibacter sp.]|jgi:hypothetical protein|uniref:hypothetical protein n=1 Tax=Tepidibacter sp. TaxID=2529387 RepID=UPI0025D24ED9|nr:hypothetical protein [Tepidibacter sp.]MCT4507724.1 hypothetical protein [Tepidibacter sp.]